MIATTTQQMAEAARSISLRESRLKSDSILADMDYYTVLLSHLGVSDDFQMRLIYLKMGTERFKDFLDGIDANGDFNPDGSLEEGNFKELQKQDEMMKINIRELIYELTVELKLHQRKPLSEKFAKVLGSGDDPDTYRPSKSEIRRRELIRLKNLFLPPHKRKILPPWKPENRM
ncbi:hypothetical protein GCM10007304_30170 [Rhodococcoides trifolii]|uniref:Uncharacterized protein n=1 Tax=Rhodococcoides trifolii TaxID=908250 RepID=A0A917LDH4_9NOCA|nr:hypothetical protein [Rhodococcus trifolii]GGG14057.1 hypothetical protein GCM10007304_30170 [Rhodococcus trifolii]